MKFIDYSILLKEEVNIFERKIINLYWEVYFDSSIKKFRFNRTLGEIIDNLHLEKNFPLEKLVMEKSCLIIFDPDFSCSSCKKPLKINSRNLDFWLRNEDKNCVSCNKINTYAIIKELIDKVEIYNNRIKKKLNVVMQDLTYLDKIYILAIYDNILLDEVGKLESSDCKNFWVENFCQNNSFFNELFDKEILIEIDENLFNYSRIYNEINYLNYNCLDVDVVNYLRYVWSKKYEFGIYLNYPVEFYSHDVWVESIRLDLKINNLNNSDMESLVEFFTYIRYRESLIVINDFLLKENLEVNRGDFFKSALNSFIENNSLFDLIYFIEHELKFEVSILKNKTSNLKGEFIKFDFSTYLLKFKRKNYSYSAKKPSYLHKSYFAEYFEKEFSKRSNEWFDYSLCEIIQFIKSKSGI